MSGQNNVTGKFRHLFQRMTVSFITISFINPNSQYRGIAICSSLQKITCYQYTFSLPLKAISHASGGMSGNRIAFYGNTPGIYFVSSGESLYTGADRKREAIAIRYRTGRTAFHSSSIRFRHENLCAKFFIICSVPCMIKM